MVAVVCAVVVAGPASGAGTRPNLPSLSQPSLTNACGDAVDSHGDVYVAQGGAVSSTIGVYDPSGSPLTSFSVSGFACSLAVDASGNLYVSTLLGAVTKYNPSEYPPVSTPSPTTYTADALINGNGVIDPGPSRAVAVNPASQDVYVSRPLANEVQVFAFSGFVAGETFSLGSLPVACSGSTTSPIEYASAATLRANIETALKNTCSGGVGGDFSLAGTASALRITFQGQFAHQDIDPLSCAAVSSASGTCHLEPASPYATNGTISYVAQYHSDGALVSDEIGSALDGANYSGLDVYGTTGRVYALDGAHSQIAVFNPGATTPASTIDGSATPDGSFGASVTFGQGLAVDQATGHVFVFDGTHNLVDEFKTSGEYVTQLTTPLTGVSYMADIAIDNSGGANDGTIYVADKETVQAYGAMTYDQLTLTVLKNGSGAGVVSGGSVENANVIDCGPTCEAEFDPGTEVTLKAMPDLGSTVAGWREGDCEEVLGPAGEECKLTITGDTAVTATFVQRKLAIINSGTGSGRITSEPAGINCGITCEATFPDQSEVKLAANADAGSKFGGWDPKECDSVEEGICTVKMTADRHVDAVFNSRPLVNDEKASKVTESSAALEASINPEGSTTTYYFEYISEEAWLENGESFTGEHPAAREPASPSSIGAATAPLSVGVAVEGLKPFTAYRFRIVAENEVEPVFGERDEADEEVPHVFTTYPGAQVDTNCPNQSLRSGASALLPDCRAYEQATPVDKNGGSIQGKAPIARASITGGAISFESPAGIPDGTGAQEFPTYIGKRGVSGWSTVGLLP
ncbi:MAG TPA: hypothetical protein VE197_04330, partial [Mycobacterium sp.]|nr:hypothetical protein [Mycobacterium sp.]